LCTTDFRNSFRFHGFIKTGARVSIKDYRGGVSRNERFINAPLACYGRIRRHFFAQSGFGAGERFRGFARKLCAPVRPSMNTKPFRNSQPPAPELVAPHISRKPSFLAGTGKHYRKFFGVNLLWFNGLHE
jgi:hypothetical protein